MTNKIETLVIALTLIIIAGIFYNFGNIILLMFPLLQNIYGITFIKLFTMILGFVIIPIYILRLVQFDTKTIGMTINVKIFLMLIVTVILLNYFLLKSDELFTALIVSFCEEFLFRYLLFGFLQQSYTNMQSVLIVSLMFGLVLHLNGNFIINLLIKVPAGIVLSVITKKFGLQFSVVIHWLNNMLVGKLI